MGAAMANAAMEAMVAMMEANFMLIGLCVERRWAWLSGG
jgi:hypothetical protein